MDPFTQVTGIAAALPAANQDTDIIMPKQFLKGTDRQGLALGVFHHLRFQAPGVEREDFTLNRVPWREARFLVVGPNFGCGSSREHAVWGLRQWGVRAVLGTTFGGIFFDNCLNNGVLALSLPPAAAARLLELAADPARCRMTIDLPAQEIRPETGDTIPFALDARRKNALVLGLDPVAATLEEADAIRAFERAHHLANPWLA
jgi:3-isopropylmalate/(R)-2-methylmalate dehydratase small subunit